MNTNKQNNFISAVAALCLLAVFGVMVLGLLLSGARVYNNLTARGSRDFDRRTCQQYLSTKLHQAQSPDSIHVTQFGSGDALFLYESYGNRRYVTRVYCHNGWLMELFTVDSQAFSPEDGEKILPLDTLKIQEDQGLLTLNLQMQEENIVLHHALRGWEHEE